MKECICVQCSEHAPGYAPEYWQCEKCQLYGTKDEFSRDREGDGLCDTCRDLEMRHKHAVYFSRPKLTKPEDK